MTSLQSSRKFDHYVKYGGLPTGFDLLNNPIQSSFRKDLQYCADERCHCKKWVRDAALLQALNLQLLCKWRLNRKIDYLTSSGRKVTSDPIDHYLMMLENAFIICKANRYDLKGKLFLKTLQKYYIVDMGIRNQLTGLRNTDYGHVLENLVYLELLRRGYHLAIGKVGALEVDFVARKADEKLYFQVAATILDETTRQRELRPLESIADNYPKYILIMDQTVFRDYSGIKVKNIIDFLLE